MASDTVIRVENVSKKFCKSMYHVMKYGSMDIAKDFFALGVDSGVLRDGEFWAVNDVSFEVKRGETLGLVGVNASGKTTLLKMLNGIFFPDKGKISVEGRVAALIGVGAGFHQMLSGRENVYVNGTILGLTKKEIDEKFDDILAFADIGEFIDSPVKHYSSGMYVRLGFAVAIHCNMDILLVDEILAVGDVNFQKKCFDKIYELRKEGVTVIFVSHSIGALERICTKSLLLNYGKQISLGSTRECIKKYFDIISQNNLDKPSKKRKAVIGTGDVELGEVFVYEEGSDKSNPNVGLKKNIIMEFDYSFINKEDKFNQIRITLKTFEGREIQKFILNECPFVDNKVYSNEKICDLNDKGKVFLKIISPKLFPQTYKFDIAFLKMNANLHLGAWVDVGKFRVTHPKKEEDIYLEYGNLVITVFEYDVEVCQ